MYDIINRITLALNSVLSVKNVTVKTQGEHMLRPEDFFDLSRTKFADIFEGTELVWEVLKKLKKYAGEIISPNISHIPKGTPVAKTLILYKNSVIDDGFSIEEGNVSGGGLVVKKDNEILKLKSELSEKESAWQIEWGKKEQEYKQEK